MQIGSIKREISGFDYMLHRLDIQSGVGRELLSSLCWYAPGSEQALETELIRVETLRHFIAGRATVPLEKLKLKFSQIWDIRGTFGLLADGVVDDVQLFEIKRFALLIKESSGHLATLLQECRFHPEPEGFPDLSEVIAILDPRGENLPTFYIYDEYSPELAAKRKALITLDADAEVVHIYEGHSGGVAEAHALAPEADGQAIRRGASTEDGTVGSSDTVGAIGTAGSQTKGVSEEMARLQSECEELERSVREELAVRLRPHIPVLKQAMRLVAYWDLLIAKACLADSYDLVRPQIIPAGFSGTEERKPHPAIRFRGLFHPMVKDILEAKKHRYQAVDIALEEAPCLLTGANMSGKTVLLKSLALAQCLFQFGFPVPAKEASLVLFDRVELLVQDDQNEEKGLSSFGAEMQRLNEVFVRIGQGAHMLLLIDELARTTNPSEGKAIVSAVLESLESAACVSMVSTHYGPIPNPVRRLRVRGFREDWAADSGKASTAVSGSDKPGSADLEKERHFDISGIQACMDYSLVEEEPGEAPPMEALRIAALLGFDSGVLAKARRYYERDRREQE